MTVCCEIASILNFYAFYFSKCYDPSAFLRFSRLLGVFQRCDGCGIFSYDGFTVATGVIFIGGNGLNLDFEHFFQANERRIHYQIHRLGITDSWYDDFYAEGLVAMWQAYKEFDTAKGNIGTFVNYRIRYRLIDLLRKRLRESEAAEAVVEETGQTLVDGNVHRGSQLPVLRVRGIELTDDAFWQKVRAQLTERQWKWVHYFIICELTVKEITELENVSADAVKGWGREVRRKLRDEAVFKQLISLL